MTLPQMLFVYEKAEIVKQCTGRSWTVVALLYMYVETFHYIHQHGQVSELYFKDKSKKWHKKSAIIIHKYE